MNNGNAMKILIALVGGLLLSAISGGLSLYASVGTLNATMATLGAEMRTGLKALDNRVGRIEVTLDRRVGPPFLGER